MFSPAGKKYMRGLMDGTETTAFTYVALGTGSGANNAGRTTLQTEVGRFKADVVQYADGKAWWQITLAPGVLVGSLIHEWGVFNAASGGTMLFRRLLATPLEPILISADDEMEITIEVRIA